MAAYTACVVAAMAWLLRWLAVVDITRRYDLKPVFEAMAEVAGAASEFEHPFRGYAQYAVLTCPSKLLQSP